MSRTVFFLFFLAACNVMAQQNWEAAVGALKSGTGEAFTVYSENKAPLVRTKLVFSNGLAEISFEAKGNVPVKYALFGKSGTTLGPLLTLSGEWEKHTFRHYFENPTIGMQIAGQVKGEFSIRNFKIAPAKLPEFRDSAVPASEQDISTGKHGKIIVSEGRSFRQGKRWTRLLTIPAPQSTRPIFLFLELASNGLGKPGIELRREAQLISQIDCDSGTAWHWKRLGPIPAQALFPNFDVCVRGSEETLVSIARAVISSDQDWKPEDGTTTFCLSSASLTIGRGSSGFQAGPFIRLKENNFADAATTLKMTYNEDALCAEFHCQEEALVPAANRLHEFKSELPRVRDNDYVVLLLKRGETVYDFFATGAGQLESARSNGPDYWGARDATWKPKTKVQAAIENGFWKLRMEIPWNELGGTPQTNEEWLFQAGRNARPGKEISLLFPTMAGFHAEDDFGKLIFSDSVPEIKTSLPNFLPGENRIEVENASVAGEIDFSQGRTQFWGNVFRLAQSGNFAFSWRLFDPVTLQVYFTSPAYRLSTTAIPLQFAAGNQLRLNGKIAKSGVILNDGLNNIEVKMPFQGALQVNQTALQLPAEKFTLAVNSTLLWPNWQAREIAIPSGGLQMLLFSPRGFPGQELDDYSIKLNLPSGFRLECASGYYKNYQLSYTADGLIEFLTPISYQEVLPSHKFIAAFIRAPKQPSETSAVISFASESKEKNIIEVPQYLNIRVLPELNGHKPANLKISMSSGWLKTLTEESYLDTVAKEFSLAGINLLSGLPSSLLPHLYMFSFAEWSWPLSPFVKEHPEAALTLKNGQKNRQLICPQYIRKSDFANWLETQMPQWFERAKNSRHIDWDYEYSYDSGPFSCYCPECLQESDVVSRNQVVAYFARLLRDTIKKYRPDTTFSMYSGYQSSHTKSIYGIDWSMLMGTIDIARCGYGRPLAEIADTYKAIGDTPLIIGAIITPYDAGSRAYPIQYTPALLLRRAADATGGILLYEYSSMDGNSLRAVSAISRIMAQHEDFFRFGKRLTETIAGWPETDAQLIEYQGKKLLLLMNSGKAARQYQEKSIAPGEVHLEIM